MGDTERDKKRGLEEVVKGGKEEERRGKRAGEHKPCSGDKLYRYR